tara:strand:+ start:55 stop:435 length:381 start_codon:yes stop_codon:yes gene_type:complete
MTKSEIIKYIDNAIGFYFDGGFEEMIADSQLDQKEIQNWLNIAVLFANSVPSDIDESVKETAFTLIEDLYTSGEVEVMSGGSLSDINLEEVGDGYEYDESYFKPIMVRAYNFLIENGLELSDGKHF